MQLENEPHGKFDVKMVFGEDDRLIAVLTFSMFQNNFKTFTFCERSGITNAIIYDFVVNGTCVFFNDEPNVVSFYNDLQIREGVVEFPPGATIVSR